MTNVVSINGKPTPANQRVDSWNRPMYKFSFQYRHDDMYFDVDFWAYNEADALEKLDAMKRTMKYVGQAYQDVG